MANVNHDEAFRWYGCVYLLRSFKGCACRLGYRKCERTTMEQALKQKNNMLTPQQIAKEIDALERQGMPRPAAERKFWDVYQRAKQYTDNDTPSFGRMLDLMLHPKATDSMVGKVGYVDELRINDTCSRKLVQFVQKIWKV